MGAHVRLAGPDYDDRRAPPPRRGGSTALQYKDDPSRDAKVRPAASSTKFMRSRASNISWLIKPMEMSPTCGTTCIN